LPLYPSSPLFSIPLAFLRSIAKPLQGNGEWGRARAKKYGKASEVMPWAR